VSQKTGVPSEPRDEVDLLLQETLRDDLPAEVEARLERGIERFVATRAKAARLGGEGFLGLAWAWTPRAMAVTASLLLACGFGLQASTSPDGVFESLSDVSVTTALAREIRGATSMKCEGLEDAALASPAALADRLYRQWVLLGSAPRPGGTVLYEFRAQDEPARYQLVSEGPLRPPREIRKDSRAGYVATCTWEVRPAGTPGIVLMLTR
jgi:hypothetical protein